MNALESTIDKLSAGLDLAGLIDHARDANTDARKAAEQAVESAVSAVEYAAQCGVYLLAIKRQSGPDDPGMEEIYQRCGIPRDTASKYMRLAAAVAEGRLELRDYASARAAYQAVGILPAPEPGDAGPASPLPAWSRAFTRIEFAARQVDPDALGVPERRMLLEQLRPAVELYRKLEGLL